ncbi:MAG: 50S ribosomal protein L24 [Desulfarculaceae bacterium]|jgi:large subunit ribosomal protein L24
MKAKLNLKKDDRVMVTTGRDKGKVGKVLRVDPVKGRVVVEKVNMIKRHTRGGTGKTGSGGILEKEAPVAVSNLMVMCEKCAEPVRMGRQQLEDGRRVRVCKKCGEHMDS